MTATVVDLPSVQALGCWVAADQYQTALDALAEQVGRCQSALLLTAGHRRTETLELLSAAQAEFKSVLRSLEEARRKALLASSRAANGVWGVRLGHEYSFQAPDSRLTRFVVDFIRPQPGRQLKAPQGAKPAFICAGEHNGRRELVVLGVSHELVAATTSNVIHLGNVMRAAS